MLVTLLPIDTDVSFLLFLKASLPIWVTVYSLPLYSTTSGIVSTPSMAWFVAELAAT